MCAFILQVLTVMPVCSWYVPRKHMSFRVAQLEVSEEDFAFAFLELQGIRAVPISKSGMPQNCSPIAACDCSSTI